MALTAYLALLRAINVGGRNRVGMADLRELVAELGFTDPRTLLQTGNLVFRGASRSAARLEVTLEKEVGRRLGVETDIFVRTVAEWDKVMDGNPFPKEAERDPAHLLVMALKEAPGKTRVADLRGAIRGRETVEVVGRQAYLVYPDGIGRSKLTIALIEKKLGTRGTARNWNTVQKLAELMEEKT